MEPKCYKPVRLYDITMYGGENTPWNFSLVRKNGSDFLIEQGVRCTATLTIAPFDAVPNPVGYINYKDIVLQKTATFESSATGGTVAVFEFAEADTKELCGKFIYQVEVNHHGDTRIGQGNLTILYNINQEVSADEHDLLDQ